MKMKTDHCLCFALQLFGLFHVKVSLLSAKKKKEEKAGVGHTNKNDYLGQEKRVKKRAYLSDFACGFPGLALPFGKEGTGKGFAASPEDPFKTHPHVALLAGEATALAPPAVQSQERI